MTFRDAELVRELLLESTTSLFDFERFMSPEVAEVPSATKTFAAARADLVSELAAGNGSMASRVQMAMTSYQLAVEHDGTTEEMKMLEKQTIRPELDQVGLHKKMPGRGLADLGLGPEAFQHLARQGFVSSENRGTSGPYYKLRFRVHGRQVVRYLGKSRQVAIAVAGELERLQASRRCDCQLGRLVLKQVNPERISRRIA